MYAGLKWTSCCVPHPHASCRLEQSELSSMCRFREFDVRCTEEACCNVAGPNIRCMLDQSGLAVVCRGQTFHEFCIEAVSLLCVSSYVRCTVYRCEHDVLCRIRSFDVCRTEAVISLCSATKHPIWDGQKRSCWSFMRLGVLFPLDRSGIAVVCRFRAYDVR